MRGLASLVGVALLAAQLAFAGGVEIKGGEKPIPVYSFAVLSVDAADKDQVSWQVYPVPVKSEVSGGKLYLAGQPGVTYTVGVTVVNFDTKRFDQGTGSVAWAGDGGGGSSVDPSKCDPLTVSLQDAYSKETAADKALLPKLAGVYTAAITQVDLSATWGDLFKAMTQTAVDAGITGHLPKVQTVIAARLVENLPSKGASTLAMDAAGKAKAKAEFKKVAQSLSKVK